MKDFFFKLQRSIITFLLSFGLVFSAFGVGVVVVVFLFRTQAVVEPTVFPQPFTLEDGAIIAPAAIVYDLTDGTILFSKNAETPMPLASLTKLMTAYVVLEHTATNTLVTITPRDIALAGEWGLRSGDTMPLRDLLKLSLVASSNDAMAAAAHSVGDSYVAQMNSTAARLGLSKTYFLNPTGLDVNQEVAGGYGSAYDVARLAGAFFTKHPEYFSFTTQKSVSITEGDRVVTSLATAAPMLDIPGFLGAKTGYTRLSQGNLVAIFDIEIGHPVAVVVLGSTELGRFTDVRTLINHIRRLL